MSYVCRNYTCNTSRQIFTIIYLLIDNTDIFTTIYLLIDITWNLRYHQFFHNVIYFIVYKRKYR